MHSYSFCVASGLRVEPNLATDVAVVCDDIGKHCTTYFGAAPKGLAFVFVRPAEGVYGHDHYGGPRDIVAAAPHAGQAAPEIFKVELDHDKSEPDRQCFMARKFLAWAAAWDEVYGLEVKNHLFSIWTRYEDDPESPEKVKQYRAEILGILSSISPN